MSPSKINTTEHYQIAIVGGGIAGVTLALACEKLGIEYALFEARDSLSPAEGASLGLQANGMRVLEQLGVLREIEQLAVPLTTWRHWDGDGNLLCTSNALGYYASKIGYGSMCLERQKVLEIISAGLQGKGLIKTSCRVESLQEEEDMVTVNTADGLSITADLVVGADGVRSCVRKFIDLSQSEAQVESDDYMAARFACVYGISNPVTGISAGDTFCVYREGVAVFSFTGKDGRFFWFVVEDLGKTVPLSKIPRYTEKDADAVCQSVAHLRVAPTILFGDIYANRTACVKIALEEGIAEVWHTGRTVLVGDAAHKMVPNAAMGGNQAIESVALLLNEFGKASKASPKRKIPNGVLKEALARYSEQRRRRVTAVQRRAGLMCRALLRNGGPAANVYQELPSLTDADWLVRAFMGFSDAPMLDGIEPSIRGALYDKAVASFWDQFRTGEYSNPELFGLDTDEEHEMKW